MMPSKKKVSPDSPEEKTEERTEFMQVQNTEPEDTINAAETLPQEGSPEASPDTPAELAEGDAAAQDVPIDDSTENRMPEAGPEGTVPPDEDAQSEILSLDITPLGVAPMESESPLDDALSPTAPALEELTPKTPPDERRAPPKPKAAKPRSDRQDFFDLDFNDLDRDLTTEERQEWNAIYASYRGRSALSGTIIGVDRHAVNVRDPQSGALRQDEMYCVIVVPYRVRIVIPAAEMWETEHERPDFVLQNMVGSTIDFIIIKVDREAGFAIASRRTAAKARRFYFSRRPTLHKAGAKTKCRVLAVGPRRCLVECFGHDINLTQRELRYSAIPDLRDEYHPGQELECIVKQYDPETETLKISVKETFSNPFDGASDRHPVGCRRQATISGKYGGGVFCNLPDGTVCMCSYAYQYDDSQFNVGDSAIVVIQRYDFGKKQIYGKIISKW